MKTQRQHEESGCTDYLQHNADSCPVLAQTEQRNTSGFVDLRERDDNGRFKPKQIERDTVTRPQTDADLSRSSRVLASYIQERDQYKAHAERLAEALGNVRMALTLDFTGKHKHAGLCEQYPELEKFRRMASEALAAWEGAQK